MGVRSPGFEPGSSTWQADVLNHSSENLTESSVIPVARLRPLHLDYGHFYMSWCLFSFSEQFASVNVCDLFQILVLLVELLHVLSLQLSCYYFVLVFATGVLASHTNTRHNIVIALVVRTDAEPLSS
jgi:hypothetical protein